MPPSPETRASLLIRLRDRDEEAWQEFVAIYEPLILRLMQQHGLQPHDADDVCQQVLQAVMQDLEQWSADGRSASFRRWLFRVARNRIIKFLVKERKRLRGAGGTTAQQSLAQQPDAPQPDAEATFDREYRRQALLWAARQIRHEFRENTWQAFWQTWIEGRSVSEVAVQLGMSTGNVYVARSRIVARLRSRVQGLGDETLDWAGGEEKRGINQ